jgi:hypothetical protein
MLAKSVLQEQNQFYRVLDQLSEVWKETSSVPKIVELSL